MIYETRINLRNKTKEELIMFVNEGLEIIQKYERELIETKEANRQLNIEIEKLKKHNTELLSKLKNRVKEVNKLTRYSLYKKEFSTLNKQLQNKDKVIDEMAKHIQENEFYDDIICMEKNCKNEACHGDCGEDCIKEYFTNKVEKEGVKDENI